MPITWGEFLDELEAKGIQRNDVIVGIRFLGRDDKMAIGFRRTERGIEIVTRGPYAGPWVDEGEEPHTSPAPALHIAEMPKTPIMTCRRCEKVLLPHEARLTNAAGESFHMNCIGQWP